MRERRIMERFYLHLPALVSLSGEDPEKEEVELMTKNISASGAFLETDRPLPVGTELKMNVVIPLNGLSKVKGKKAAISVTGSVVRSEKRGMAMCFDEEYQILPLRSD